MKKLTILIFLTGALSSYCCYGQRNISVDLFKKKGAKPQYINNCIGAGRAYEGLRADWQEQLRITVKDCGFKYIRFHGIFQDEMAVYRKDKDGKPIYNWQYIDKLYDFLLSIHVRPFVELSFTPSALKSSDKSTFYWRAYVGYPNDYESWTALVTEFIKHLQLRYGENEVAQWYFEVWNEPNHKAFSSSSSLEEYSKFYQVSAEAVKSVSANFKVGGPATAGIRWITELVKYCNEHKVPIDFISTHTYGIESFFDEFGTQGARLKTDTNAIVKDVAFANQLITDTKQNLPLHFTEWSTSSSSRDAVHDTYQNATYILNTLRNIKSGYLKSMSYWVFTDIFEEAGPPTTPFHGGFGLLNLQGIKKPTYYIFKFLNDAGPTEVFTNDNKSWAFISKNGAQLLFWDFTLPNQTSINQVYFRKDLPPVKRPDALVNIDHLDNGKYRYNLYKVGYGFNDAFTAYYKMGLPTQLTTNQVNELKSLCNGNPIDSGVINITNNKYKKVFTVRSNDIMFITLTKIK